MSAGLGTWLAAEEPWSVLKYRWKRLPGPLDPAAVWEACAGTVVSDGQGGINRAAERIVAFEASLARDIAHDATLPVWLDEGWLSELETRRQIWAIGRLEDLPGQASPWMRLLADGPVELHLPGDPTGASLATSAFLAASDARFRDAMIVPALFLGLAGEAQGRMERVRISAYQGHGAGLVLILGARTDDQGTFQLSVDRAWKIGWAAGAMRNRSAGPVPDAILWLPGGRHVFEGPSMGLAVAAAALAMATGTAFPEDLAFSGEVLADGTVGPVKGIREKWRAAVSDGRIASLVAAPRDAAAIPPEPSRPRPIAVAAVADLATELSDPWQRWRDTVQHAGSDGETTLLARALTSAGAFPSWRELPRQVMFCSDPRRAADAIGSVLAREKDPGMPVVASADLLHGRSLEGVLAQACEVVAGDGRLLRILAGGVVPLHLVVVWYREPVPDDHGFWMPGGVLDACERLAGKCHVTLIMPSLAGWRSIRTYVSGLPAWRSVEPWSIPDRPLAALDAFTWWCDSTTGARHDAPGSRSWGGLSFRTIGQGQTAQSTDAMPASEAFQRDLTAVRVLLRLFDIAAARQLIRAIAPPPNALDRALLDLVAAIVQLPAPGDKSEDTQAEQLDVGLSAVEGASRAVEAFDDLCAAAVARMALLRAFGHAYAMSGQDRYLDRVALSAGQGLACLYSLGERWGIPRGCASLPLLADIASIAAAASIRSEKSLAKLQGLLEVNPAVYRDAPPRTAGRLLVGIGRMELAASRDPSGRKALIEGLERLIEGRSWLAAACTAHLLAEKGWMRRSQAPYRILRRFLKLRDGARVRIASAEGAPVRALGLPPIATWEGWFARASPLWLSF